MRRLAPGAMFPAGVPGIRVTHLKLRTGLECRVAESGAPDAPPVVLLHGWGASLFMHRDLLERLPAAGFRAIAPDLRGHGLSDKPVEPGAYTSAAFRDDLLALLDVLSIERAMVVGQSLGGAIALHVALAAPSRITALVLVNPAGLTRTRYPVLARFMGRWLVERCAGVLPPRWVVALVLRRLAYGGASRVEQGTIDEYWAPSRDRRWVCAMRSILAEFDWTPVAPAKLQEIGAPILVVVGDHDRVIGGLLDAIEGLPMIEAVTVTGGHAVNEEWPGEVTPRIIDFLRARRLHGS